MDFKKILSVASALTLLQGSFGAVVVSAKSEADDVSRRRIVVYHQNISDEAREQILDRVAFKKVKGFRAAIAADVLEDLTDAEAVQLASDPRVRRVEDDAVATIQTRPESAGRKRSGGDVAPQSQTIPWGMVKIEATLVWPLNTGAAVKVGIIDTGISTKHPDLVGNIAGGVNTINPWKSYNDDNGHGTHVAGIVAAQNNTIGVVGVAPQVNLYAIKVLGANGSGWISDVIEGIDWAVANHLRVINMSLGSNSDVQSLHDAIIAATNAGIVAVAAAGNSGGAVIYPAAYPEVIAVSATDASDQLASWSSRGAEVDVAAPGVSILSTYKGTGYATLSGTSMASPHVAGAAALILKTIPTSQYDLDLDGTWDPAEVQRKLQDTALDLGATGFDPLYGWGRINAFSAVQ